MRRLEKQCDSADGREDKKCADMYQGGKVMVRRYEVREGKSW
nr:hypothetical protein [Mediterraneibacter glycyrrhizinilyticus]